MNTTPLSFSGEEDFNMVKKFNIVSCAALVASLSLFAQDAGATARHSEATALAPGASTSAPIRLAAQRTYKKAPKKTNKTKSRKVTNKPKPTNPPPEPEPANNPNYALAK